MRLKLYFTTFLSLWAVIFTADAAVLQLNSPTFDRWVYPFNFTPGTRATASAFGAVGTGPGVFDDRDGQFYLHYDTSSATGDFAPGQGVGNYQVDGLTLRLTAVSVSGSVFYDPSYDPVSTYGGGTDSDPSRPFELFGAGFRNGFMASTFGETGPHSIGDPTIPGTRNVFASDALGNDVSNNFTNFGGSAFDVDPFAVGTASTLNPGDAITAGTVFEFDVNLADADIANYVQEGLNSGGLSFVLTSLQETTQTNPTIVNWGTKEGGSSASMTVVPEPSSVALLGLGGAVLAFWRRHRHRA